MKIQAFDSNYFREKSHFEDNGTQNYLLFQPVSIQLLIVVKLQRKVDFRMRVLNHYWRLIKVLLQE